MTIMKRNTKLTTMNDIYLAIFEDDTSDTSAEFYKKASLTELTPIQQFQLQQEDERERLLRTMDRVDMVERLNKILGW